jgi:hypothetical protein
MQCRYYMCPFETLHCVQQRCPSAFAYSLVCATRRDRGHTQKAEASSSFAQRIVHLSGQFPPAGGGTLGIEQGRRNGGKARSRVPAAVTSTLMVRLRGGNLDLDGAPAEQPPRRRRDLREKGPRRGGARGRPSSTPRERGAYISPPASRTPCRESSFLDLGRRLARRRRR